MEPPSCRTCGTGFGKAELKSWIIAGGQTILSCIGWGSKPTLNGSHNYSKHMKGNWQILYAVDGDMGPPTCCYHHTCGTKFGKAELKSSITAGGQMILSCIGWAVLDGVMELPSCCYHHTCGGRFQKAAEIIDHCWVTNDTIMHWLRLLTHIEWDSHIHSKHIKQRTLYAVNGVMEPPSCCYHHTCGTRFGKSVEIMDHCWVPNDTIMHWFWL